MGGLDIVFSVVLILIIFRINAIGKQVDSMQYKIDDAQEDLERLKEEIEEGKK